ncbi:unnamed protein product [Phytomonas sp. EM1]|nr:unnamed protein product [Phytomonas sp. EM1]|eukprot:CCW61206.1 unnamed protein product [Phytomonas sp. isolate EM1]
MGNPYRLTSKRTQKLVGYDVLHEGEPRVRPDPVQRSPLFTDHNPRLNRNTDSTEPLQQALRDKELEKIANLFLSNAPLSQKETVAQHETIMSGSPPSNRKQKKTKHKAMIIKDANLTSVEDNIRSSLPLSCAVKLREKRRLGKSNNSIKSCKSKGRDRIIEDVILASSNTESGGHRGFFVDLEGGGNASEENLSRQVLQQAAAFLTKLKPIDRRFLWDHREVAQGTHNGKDVFKLKATNKDFLKGMPKESVGGLCRTVRRNTVVDAKPFISLKKGSIVPNDDWIGSEVDTDSSSDPSLVSDSDCDIKEEQGDFDGDLESGNGNKGTPLRSLRNQSQNGGRLFTGDDDMWSD